MTPADFTAWVALMKERGYSERDLVKMLGTGSNQITRWRRNGAPPYIGLACAALAYGLQSWRQPENLERSAGTAPANSPPSFRA